MGTVKTIGARQTFLLFAIYQPNTAVQMPAQQYLFPLDVLAWTRLYLNLTRINTVTMCFWKAPNRLTSSQQMAC